VIIYQSAQLSFGVFWPSPPLPF